MEQSEIISGNDEICQMLGWVTQKVYVYQVPNSFPSNEESGWTEFNTQEIGFHTDWNLLIGAYNKALLILNDLSDTAKILLQEDKNFFANFGVKHMFGVSDINWQVNISSSWRKLCDFAKWYNSIKLFK